MEREPVLRDELFEPLGIGLNAPRSGSRRRAGLFAAVAAAAVAAQLSFLICGALRTGGGGAASATAAPVAVAALPPSRLAEVVDAPSKPLSAAAPSAEKGAEPGPAKPPHARAGAPEPLIIDVQQALAALKARDAPTAFSRGADGSH